MNYISFESVLTGYERLFFAVVGYANFMPNHEKATAESSISPGNLFGNRKMFAASINIISDVTSFASLYFDNLK
jgi:hypothetical protein